MAEKFYITADTKRPPTKRELKEIGVPGVSVFEGRIKAVIEAETWQEAMERGKECILGCLDPSHKALNFAWMPVKDAKNLGDIESYDRYKTATWVYYYRTKRGMTQTKLAEESGVNIRQIQKIEAGEIEPGNVSARNIIALSEALGINPKNLL